MNEPSLPPLADDLPAAAREVHARASRHESVHAGRRMVWHRWGADAGEPVVLLHGGSGSWTHWLRNVETLAATGRAVWAPDLPGFGESDRPATGNDADAMVEPLSTALREWFGASPVDVVGFSFGGLVGGLAAAGHPEQVRRLVLVGAPALALSGLRLGLTEWRHLPTSQERAAVHRANLAALMLHHRESITPLAVALHAANLERDRLRRRKLARTEALQMALPQVRCPMAAIYGRDDVLYRDRTDALEASLRSLPLMQSFEFVEGAGHWVQFERAEAFDAALRRALDIS